MLSFKVLGEDQQIPNLEIVSMLEDSRGEIWIGLAHGGVIKYNSCQLEFFPEIKSLQGSPIMDIAEDKLGNIWFATFGDGLIKYDGNCFYTYTTQSGFPGDYIMCLHFTSEGKMMAGLNGQGIVDLNDDGFKASPLNRLLPNQKIWSLLEDHEGSIWVGLVQFGLCRISDNQIDVWSSSTHRHFPGGTIRCLYEDSINRIWASTNDGIVNFTQSPEGYKMNLFPDYPEQIHDILEISGKLWFASNLHGLFMLEGDDLIHLGSNQGLVNERIKCLLKDRESNLWIGSLGGGIMRLDSWLFQNYYKENGIPESVSAIAQLNDGRVIIASKGGGLYVKDGMGFSKYEIPDALDQVNIWALHVTENDEIWMATDGRGLVKLSDGQIKSWNNEDEFGNRFLCIEEDKTGIIYAGGFDGITCVYPNGISEKMTHKDLHGVEIWDLFFDSNQKLWIGTDGEGLWTLAEGETGKILVKAETNGELENAVITYIDGSIVGKIWLALEVNGLGKLECTDKESYKFTAFKHQDFENIDVYALAVLDAEVWLGTATGLIQIIHQEKGLSIKKYDRQDGIRTIQATSGRVHKDANQHLWWPTEKYLIEYLPENAKKQLTLPSVKIVDIGLMNEKTTNWAKISNNEGTFNKRSYWASLWKGYIEIENIEAWSHFPSDLSLSHEQNKINFHYSINSWNSSKSLEYQYHLKNFDKNWISVGNSTTAEYTNLPPGSYTFEVRVRDSTEQWSVPASFHFAITPPFWKTPWFIALAALTIGFLFYALLKWRLRRINQEKDLLEEQVELRTSELVEEKDKSERLLLNFLPAETVEELKEYGTASTKNYDQASVLFSDFKGFTRLSESITPQELIETLDLYFQAFDEVAIEYGVEKIKTIGDAYMCACGIPMENQHHAALLVAFGLHMLHLAQGINRNRKEHGEKAWKIRVGIHSGPLIAGVVGKTKIAYDIWGDTVNIASRMESCGEENKINVSAACKALCEEYFIFSGRGAVAAKNKGLLEMYFVEGFKSEYALDGNVMLANEAFFRKLRRD